MTYNKINTYPFFKKRVYKLEDEEGYNPSDAKAALERSFEWGDKIPIGVVYKDQQPIYEDSEPALKNGPLCKQNMELSQETFTKLYDEFF